MAELDLNRVRLVPEFKPQRIIIPTLGCTVEDRGYRSFELKTAKGPIEVRMYSYGWFCKGRKDALLNYGLISEDWLPGSPGNNKSSQIVLLMPDGQAALGNWQHGGVPKGFPQIKIRRNSATIFCVSMPYSDAEQAELDNFKTAWEKEQKDEQAAAHAARQAWTKAKQATDPDEAFAIRWRNSVLNMIDKVAGLIDGKEAFKDFPKFKLTGVQLDEARDLVSQLEKAVRESRPTLPIVKIRSNVIGLDRRAYEHI